MTSLDIAKVSEKANQINELCESLGSQVIQGRVTAERHRSSRLDRHGLQFRRFEGSTITRLFRGSAWVMQRRPSAHDLRKVRFAPTV